MLIKKLMLTDYLVEQQQRAQKSFEEFKTAKPSEEDMLKEAQRRFQLDIHRAKSFGYTCAAGAGHDDTLTSIVLERDEVVKFDFESIPANETDDLLAKLHSVYWDIAKGWKAAREAKAQLESELQTWSSNLGKQLKEYAGYNTKHNTSYSCWEHKFTGLGFNFPYNLSHERGVWKTETDFTFSVVDYNRKWSTSQNTPTEHCDVFHYHTLEEAFTDLKAKGYTIPDKAVLKEEVKQA